MFRINCTFTIIVQLDNITFIKTGLQLLVRFSVSFRSFNVTVPNGQLQGTQETLTCQDTTIDFIFSRSTLMNSEERSSRVQCRPVRRRVQESFVSKYSLHFPVQIVRSRRRDFQALPGFNCSER